MHDDARRERDEIVALSMFTVANGMTEEVKRAFRDRPHLVEQSPGFLRMEVIESVDDANEIWLLTYWAYGDSYHSWHLSHAHHESHRGIPKGLKLVSKSARVKFVRHVGS